MKPHRRILLLSWLLYAHLTLLAVSASVAASAMNAPSAVHLMIGLFAGSCMGLVLGQMPDQRDLQEDEAA